MVSAKIADTGSTKAATLSPCRPGWPGWLENQRYLAGEMRCAAGGRRLLLFGYHPSTFDRRVASLGCCEKAQNGSTEAAMLPPCGPDGPAEPAVSGWRYTVNGRRLAFHGYCLLAFPFRLETIGFCETACSRFTTTTYRLSDKRYRLLPHHYRLMFLLSCFMLLATR